MMLFKEMEHSDDIMQDIRDVFTEEVHSLLFMTNDVFKKLKEAEGVHEENCHLDFCYHYSDESVICLEKTLNGHAVKN